LNARTLELPRIAAAGQCVLRAVLTLLEVDRMNRTRFAAPARLAPLFLLVALGAPSGVLAAAASAGGQASGTAGAPGAPGTLGAPGAQETRAAGKQKAETIVVTGTESSLASEAAELELTPGGATLVDLDDFRQRNVSSLADMLRYVPGVWAVSDAGNDDIFFSSRGSNLDATDYDMNGIKLMQDGLPVTTADGNNHNRVIDPLAARAATIARGANALKYGASTLGGAIDFITPTARDVPGAELSIRGGSHGQRLARTTLSKVFGERLDGLLTLEGKHWDGYREHNRQHRSGLYANAGWEITDALSTRFYATYLDNDQELPGTLTRAEAALDPDRASAAAIGGDYQLDVQTRRLADKTTWEIGEDRRLEAGFSLERQSLFHPIVDRVLVDFDGAGPNPPSEVYSLLVDTDQRNRGAMLRYAQHAGNHDLLFGANYAWNDVDGGEYRNLRGRPNGLRTIVDNDASTLEAFGMDRWALSDRLTLIVAAQAVDASRDVRNTDAATGVLSNPHDRYSRVNPRLGVIWNAAGSINLYANVSGLFEPPTHYQLQDNVAGGEATLEAMQGKVAEVGTRGSRPLGDNEGTFHWDVSLYYARIENEILSVEDPNAPGTSLAANIDATTHAGLEALFGAQLPLRKAGNGSIEPLVSVTINDFKFAGDAAYGDNTLPAAPKYAVRSEVVFRGRNGFEVGPTFDLVGERYADFANTYKVPGYRLLGLRAAWSNNRWRVFAELHNLGDADYVASHSVRAVAREGDAILNPGEPLSAYFGVSMEF
jgi:iron complex outermembrane receptor protein